MKRVHILGLWLLLSSTSGCDSAQSLSRDFYACRFDFPDQNLAHFNHSRYQALLDSLTRQGVPGMLMAIHRGDEAPWIGASGMADLANQVPMKSCQISRAGSVVKTFTAVAVLQLVEAGQVNLDEKAAIYLPASATDGIDNAGQATVRQLLNHSSGIYNYIQDTKFQTASLNDLVKVWQPDELLSYARGRKAYFSRGEDVKYSNTNYILLGLLIEKVTSKHFSVVFREKRFGPLALNSTFFDPANPIPAGLARGYIDMYSDLNLVESTRYSGWDYYTADGGLISNPYDLSIFMRGLFGGKLLNPASLQQMQQWRKPRNGESGSSPIEFGLGIFRTETRYGYAVFHSGDAIGYYGRMMLFPESNTVICWLTNGNYGKLDELVSSKAAMDRVVETVFEQR